MSTTNATCVTLAFSRPMADNYGVAQVHVKLGIINNTIADLHQSGPWMPLDWQHGIFGKKTPTFSLQILRGLLIKQKHRNKKFVKKASIWIIPTLTLTLHIGVFLYMYGVNIPRTCKWHCSHLRFWACAIYDNVNLPFLSNFHCTSNQ